MILYKASIQKPNFLHCSSRVPRQSVHFFYGGRSIHYRESSTGKLEQENTLGQLHGLESIIDKPRMVLAHYSPAQSVGVGQRQRLRTRCSSIAWRWNAILCNKITSHQLHLSGSSFR